MASHRRPSASTTNNGPLMDDETQLAVDIIFKGLEKPRGAADATEHVISGHVFLQQLAEVDRLIAAALQDSPLAQRPTVPEQYAVVWQSLTAALLDFGVEVPDEDVFAIISGQLATAAQLSNDIQRLNDKGYAAALLKPVGPRVPLRQRINPFRGQQQTVKGVVPQGTRLYLHEQARFSKKRAIAVDNLERLRDKEMKQMKLKERREREAQQKSMEQAKSTEAAQHRSEQDEMMNRFGADPKALAEKTKRTELLRELERLETTYSNDERLLHKLKREQTAQESPRRVAPPSSVLAQSSYALQASNARGHLSPVVLREPSSIPFSAGNHSSSPAKKPASTSKLPKKSRK
uniref:Uncharacterized protein n=1 Tax=Neobodo designis TaxID=312471 RepID=A0A7S1R103_NEODS|mmetsp:Transcript_6485/g.20382  ORF Transcript_6485/g.20382 Transcript_6485/m.20382 type:complete len:348 (+) Transcript_6485:96-1139(+)